MDRAALRDVMALERSLVRALAVAHRGLGRAMAGRSRARREAYLRALRERMRAAVLAHAWRAYGLGKRVAEAELARARARFAEGEPRVPGLPPAYVTWYEATVDEALVRYTDRVRRRFAELTERAARGDLQEDGTRRGWTNQELAEAVQREVEGMQTWQAMRIARTESMRLWNVGHWSRCEAEPEVIGYRYGVVKDVRTSDICRPLSGLTVKREELQHVPPLHPHCRTTLQPVFSWDEEPEWGDPAAVQGVPGFGAVPRLSAGELRAAGVGGPPVPLVPTVPPGGGGNSGGDEPDGVDALIKAIIDGRPPRPGDASLIRQHVAQAPFATRQVVVPTGDRGYSYAGVTLGARAAADEYHLVKRVVIERQWAEGTTLEGYLQDLRAVLADDETLVGVYRRRGEHVAAFLGRNTIPAVRLGVKTETGVFVAYSADYGKIVTGYQTGEDAASLAPTEAIWLP